MMFMMFMKMGWVKLGLAQEHSRGKLLAPGRTWASKLSQAAKSLWMETGCWGH